ncbi:DUF982 domain-containing protein [Rhizobium mesoamericanum]|uniref:Uncharacterized protein n=1 Tax=Rhizobium mesoamericanum STM3625 TaxID=1211777 RepID=K0Q417_9HYPH|nr:DUF982 domain-containing protein [Rhizobium mesoamericanum]CCM79197.1 hypothetical protein BN77_p10448 [Rhizobium mesoamericanum STM3625]
MAGEVPVSISPMDVGFEGNTGRYRHADSVEDLAAILLSDRWDWSNVPSFHHAPVPTLEAPEFYTDAANARAAFVVAAHEAGVQILPDDATKMLKAS